MSAANWQSVWVKFFAITKIELNLKNTLNRLRYYNAEVKRERNMQKIITKCDKSISDNKNNMLTVKKALDKINGTENSDFNKSNFLS